MKVVVHIRSGEIVVATLPSASAVADYTEENGIANYLVLDAPEGEEVLDRAAAIKYLNISESTLRKLEIAGKIPVSSIGRRKVYRRQDLDAFLESVRK